MDSSTIKNWNILIDDKLQSLDSQTQSLWWELEGKDINTGKVVANKTSLTEIRRKLNGIEEGANKYILPVATTTTLGGVKVDGTTITIKNSVITANDVEHAYNADYAKRVDCGTSGIGSSVKPIYIDGDGDFTPFSSTVGSSSKPVYMNQGEITVVTSLDASLVTGDLTNATIDGSRITGTITSAKVKSLADNKAEIINMIYPVGSIYMSVNLISPETIFGGTWERLQDRFLLGASSSHVNDSKGGSETVTLDVSQIPAHSHVGSTGESGKHTPTGTIVGGKHKHSGGGTSSWAGGHNHDKGSFRITGYFSRNYDYCGIAEYPDSVGGPFYLGHAHGRHLDWYSGTSYTVMFDTDRNNCWTGSTGWVGDHCHTFGDIGETDLKLTFKGNQIDAHTHSVTVENTGGSKSHDNMPPYLAVYMWKRTK